MPSKSPQISSDSAEKLHELGLEIKLRRKELKLSATVVAESAGVSRVTLHRIEKGEPSVTIGAYLAVIMSMDMKFNLSSTKLQAGKHAWIPSRIHIEDFPELKKVAWHVTGTDTLSPDEALGIYERHWHHINKEEMSEEELNFVEFLRDSLRV